MKYKVHYEVDAIKTLARMPRNTAKRIRQKINHLAADPYAPNNNVTTLQGMPGYRLRVGDWRVIYEIDDALLKILVLKIGSRGNIYNQ